MSNFLKNNFIAVVALFLGLSALIFSYVNTVNNDRIKQELVDAIEVFNEKYGEIYSDLDSKIDRWDGKISKLKEQGYVEEDDFSDISKKILSASVLVASSQDIAAVSDSGDVILLKEESIETGGAGTGFLINKDGYIVTAKHVVDAIGSENIIVKTFAGGQYRPRVVLLDEKYDLAMLKIEGENHPFVQLGYFDNFDVGEEIGFVGYSMNAGVATPLVYRGVVSVKGIDLNGSKIFTVNAFVNKGNSGGPVFSVRSGRVLGMLSARQRDASSERFITLPPNYKSAFILGGIDPVKFNVELYNKTVKIVGDVSQVGIGIAYSLDIIRELSAK